MTIETVVHPLADQVRSVHPDDIKLPILRELVRDIQSKSHDEIRCDNQHWSDTEWKQWREHGSHNPW